MFPHSFSLFYKMFHLQGQDERKKNLSNSIRIIAFVRRLRLERVEKVSVCIASSATQTATLQGKELPTCLFHD